VNPVKSKSIYKSISIIILLALSIIPTTLLTTPMKAQIGRIVLSSDVFNPYKVIEIRVEIPGLDVNNVTLRLLNSAGQPVQLRDRTGTLVTEFKAYKIATGVFYAYLGGNETNLNVNPKYPKISRSYADAFVKLAGSYDPDTSFTIEVLGYGITATVTYGYVSTELSIDRDTIPSRRPDDVKIKLTIKDQDLNFDPTAVDIFTRTNTSNITLTIIHINGTSGVMKKITANLSNATIKESAVNSGSFSVTITAKNISTWLGIPSLKKGDTLIFEAASNISKRGFWVWGDDSSASSSRIVKVVYTYPTVSVDITPQKITITITSPDDNVDPGTKDKLDKSKNVTIVYEGEGFKIPYKINATNFTETGVNTGVFKYELTVAGWSNVAQINVRNKEIYLPIDNSTFSISATYLDITGSATYTPAEPSVKVVKASPQMVVLEIEDRDLNIDPNNVERLTASRVTRDNKTLLFNISNTVLYEVTIKDSTGRAIPLPPRYNATVSFFATDLDSNVFRLTLPSKNGTRTVFEPGKTYIIEIVDHTGPKYTKTVRLTVSEIKIELDRSEYPINANKSVVVYVTYYDDRYNVDPEKIEKLQPKNLTYGVLKYRVVAVDGSTIVLGNVTKLEETEPDSGIFTATVKFNTTTPRWIDSKLYVWIDKNNNNKTDSDEISTTAVFKVYGLTPSDISVAPTTVSLTGCFNITIHDPDANVDSKNADSITVKVSGPKGDKNVTLDETGANTGIFTAKFCDIKDVASPGQTITVSYTEKTPALAPTADTFEEYEYDITATVKVVSSTGKLDVPKDWIGPFEKMTVTLTDPDLNTNPNVAEEYPPGKLKVTIEGVTQVIPLTIKETDLNSGVFTAELNMYDILKDYIIKATPETKLEDVAKYLGRSVTITYVDEATATGGREVITKTLTIKAVDAEIKLDKTAVNVGDTINITIVNPDIAQNPKPEFRRVFISSTTYPTGVALYATEISPGVYSVVVKVVSLGEWVPGAPQIPAKLGDVITILYEDPIGASGAKVMITKTVGVGVYAVKPGVTEKVESLDVATGQPIKPVVGREVFLKVSVKNVDIVEHTMTVIVVVRDPNGVAVARYAATVTLGAGASTEVSWGWTPIVSGDHTVEVYIVKSLTDRTLLSDPYTETISVGS